MLTLSGLRTYKWLPVCIWNISETASWTPSLAHNSFCFAVDHSPVVVPSFSWVLHFDFVRSSLSVLFRASLQVHSAILRRTQSFHFPFSLLRVRKLSSHGVFRYTQWLWSAPFSSRVDGSAWCSIVGGAHCRMCIEFFWNTSPQLMAVTSNQFEFINYKQHFSIHSYSFFLTLKSLQTQTNSFAQR